MSEDEALTCWMYVSVRTGPADRLEETVDDIVRVSCAWNEGHSLTGALIATASHFAQCLEGPADEVACIRAKISADPRHRDLVVLDDGPLQRRHFGDWSLAYAGGSKAFDSMAASLRKMRPDNGRILLDAMLTRFTES